MRRLPAAVAAACALLAPAALLATSPGLGSAAHAAAAPYAKTTLYFRVTVPCEDVSCFDPSNPAAVPTTTQQCEIVGDLYVPSDASATHRDPAILTTNGFGGSKDDQAALAAVAASHGYVVLSYTGLGFGPDALSPPPDPNNPNGSSCKISLDDPSYDGAAGKELVSYLGGKTGSAFTDSGLTTPAPALDAVKLDGPDDPRVGMIGGSYGGEIQFAIADVDPRLDAIIPIITWNDLSYSLAPNNTGFTHGVTYPVSQPGTEKLDWVSLFFGEGITDGLEGVQLDPTRNVGCPNFLTEACVAKAELDAGGFATQDVADFARHASVESYISHIKIPTLLAQGQADTLFNLQEATATYRALKAQGTPVKMIWQYWGHSDGTPAKGEFCECSTVLSTYEGQRFFAWFDHYLKGTAVDTGPDFAYYRDWVPFSGSGPDTVQYGTAASYPAGTTTTLYQSGSNALVAAKSAVTAGSASYTNVGGSVPTSYSETSAVQGSLPSQVTPPSDAPGTFAAWSTAPLKADLDVIGIPTMSVHVSAPTTSGATPATQLQFFGKLYDVAPDGTVDLVHRLVAPVRVADLSKPVTVQLPGIVHRFARGHTLELVMAASDAAYKNAYPVQPVTVTTSRTAPGTLTLPVLSAAQVSQALPTPSGPTPRQTAHPRAVPAGGGLAYTGSGALLPAAGAGFVGLALALRLRRRRPAARGR